MDDIKKQIKFVNFPQTLFQVHVYQHIYQNTDW